jgi:hypothetical protein
MAQAELHSQNTVSKRENQILAYKRYYLGEFDQYAGNECSEKMQHNKKNAS